MHKLLEFISRYNYSGETHFKWRDIEFTIYDTPVNKHAGSPLSMVEMYGYFERSKHWKEFTTIRDMWYYNKIDMPFLDFLIKVAKDDSDT
jgi:hypothetical protein